MGFVDWILGRESPGGAVERSLGGHGQGSVNRLNDLTESEQRYFNPNIIPSNFVGYNSTSGVYVSERTALQELAVYSCVRLLADSVASLPMDVNRKQAGGVRVPLPVPTAVAQPNPDETGFEYMQKVVASMALRGNSYEHITAFDKLEYPLSREAIHPDDVQVTRNSDDGRADYRIHGTPIPRSDMIHTRRLTLPGYLLGLSNIEQARQGIGLSIAAGQYGATWFGDSANPSAVLETAGGANLSDEASKRTMAAWVASQGGRRHPAVLSGGLTYKQITITPEESQFLACVVAGTLVTMADGTRRPVESLLAGDEVMAWNGSKLQSAKVAHVGAPPAKPLARIRTARGRELTATTDHPVLAKRRLRTPGCRPIAGEGDWIPLGGLEVGHYVRVALGSLPYDDDGMTTEEAYFLGAMTGDGYIRPRSSGWAGTEPAVIERMTAVVAHLGGSLSHKSGCDFSVKTGGVGRGGSRIWSLLKSSGLVGRHSHDKFVPESVMDGGPTAWRAFLSAYFDADGSIRDIDGKQTPAAYWASTSRELLGGCQHLLALLGIQSAVYPMHPGGLKTIRGRECMTRPSWGLYVMGTSQFRPLAAELDLAHTEKRRRLSDYADTLPSRYRAVNFDFDRVTEVEYIGVGETVGVEIEGLHTHVTAGIITHNTRAFERGQIAMIFGVPPHMIGDTQKSTSWGTGIEQQSLGFVRYTLMPWLRCIEDAYSWKLLPRGQYLKFNVDALLRGDTSTRYAAYTQARQASWLNVDEIRELEDREPLPDGLGQSYIQPLNYAPLGSAPADPMNAADSGGAPTP